jgi:hypothetical protein
VAFFVSVKLITWKQRRQETQLQQVQQLQKQQMLVQQQVLVQQQEPVRVQEQLLLFCHKQTEQQRQR